MISLLIIMHCCTFVLIPSDTNVQDAAAKALEPFDEALNVAPYRVHLTHKDVRRMARHFKIDPANTHELTKRISEWTNHEGGVDRDGLFYLSPCNPDGRWDWFEIGGRWNGYIPGAPHNTIKAGTLAKSPKLKQCLPFYVLTPEGKWIEHERCYFDGDWKKMKREQMKQAAWTRLVRETLRRWPDHQVVCVDMHC